MRVRLHGHLHGHLNIIIVKHELSHAQLLFDLGSYVGEFGDQFYFFPKRFHPFFVSVSMQTLQAEVSRLHKRLESCLKERGQSVSSSATMVQENHHHPRTSTPRVRLVVFPLMWVVERM